MAAEAGAQVAEEEYRKARNAFAEYMLDRSSTERPLANPRREAVTADDVAVSAVAGS